MVLRAPVGVHGYFPLPHSICSTIIVLFCFYFVLSLDSCDRYQIVLVQPIISLVSSSKTQDQIRCVQSHNHISCLQSKDLAEESGQVETKARCRPRNAKDPEGTKENSMYAEERGIIFLLVIE